MIDRKIQVGSILRGRIVNIEDYGVFLEIQSGIEGLLRVTEVTWANQGINMHEYFEIDQIIQVKIIHIDYEIPEISLSIKQLSKDPWTDIEQRYPIGSRHIGQVKKLTSYGIFVELSYGVGGMICNSGLSEIIKIGQDLKVVILEIDQRNRKLYLSI